MTVSAGSLSLGERVGVRDFAHESRIAMQSPSPLPPAYAGAGSTPPGRGSHTGCDGTDLVDLLKTQLQTVPRPRLASAASLAW